ncbi:hypothetical protein NE848_02880 [Gramella jeungdoensis]|uniref:Uncharacterized protein n=1 Tax=Gramella jeungdoensis TaxID=708091 RepID=A0ABT0YZ55_9FLAO|nr:hypothetical protein [Gramella jeungdoensis]MCM8568305.1 hypothetical protein [Gramella jeungdoensis]
MKTIYTKLGVVMLLFIAVLACTEDDAIPSNPIIKITGTSLSFGDVDVTESSQVRSYTIAAEDLTSEVTASVEAPFYLSLNANGEFSNSVSLSPDDFGNDAIPVFVQFQPGASDEGMYEDKIVHTSAEREEIATIKVSGIATVPGEPTLVSNESSLDFGNVVVDQTSEVKSYTLAGSDLEEDVNLEVTGPFGISLTQDGEFTSSITIDANDAMDDQSVYVRFEPTAEGEATGAIVHSSSELESDVEVALTGTGDPIPDVSVIVDPTTLDLGSVPLNQVSGAASYTLTGSGLTSDVTVTGSALFKVSRSSDGTFTESLSIPAADFETGDVEIFVQFNSTGEIGEKTGEITHTSDEVEIESVVVVASSISATTKLFLDNFDYTAGEAIPSTDRTGSGTDNEVMDGWLKVRTGNADILVADQNLTYNGYPESTGNAALLDLEGSSNVYAHNLSEQQTVDFVGAYYSSFLLKIEALPTGGFSRPVMFVDWNPNGTVKFLTSISIESNGGDPKFGIRMEGNVENSDITPEEGKTYLVVIKHTVPDADQGNNNNSGQLFVFDAEDIPATEPATADASITTGTSPGDGRLVKAITLVNDNNPDARYIVDGLKVTTQWSDLFE